MYQATKLILIICCYKKFKKILKNILAIKTLKAIIKENKIIIIEWNFVENKGKIRKIGKVLRA